MKHSIILADENKFFLEGIASVLSSVKDIEILERVRYGSELENTVYARNPSMIIADPVTEHPDGVNVAVIQKIKQEQPETKILILSMSLNLRLVLEVLTAGAEGCTPKAVEPEELVFAVHTILSGGMYLNSKVIRLLVDGYIKKRCVPTASEHLKELSVRERQVLRMISESKSMREIAEELCISRSTADTHRANLMHKLGCENLNKLLRFAISESLINLEDRQ